MTTSGLTAAILWGLALQLPWIVCGIVAGLLYWRWRTSRLGLVALALGLLIIWRVTSSVAPTALIWPLQESRPEMLNEDFVSNLYIIGMIFSFLDDVLQLAAVVFLATALLRLIQELAGPENATRKDDG